MIIIDKDMFYLFMVFILRLQAIQYAISITIAIHRIICESVQIILEVQMQYSVYTENYFSFLMTKHLYHMHQSS